MIEATSGAAYVAAQNARERFLGDVLAVLDRYDALLAPTTAVTAPAFGEIESQEEMRRTFVNTAPFNLTGHPALSIPCGDANERPVGIQFVTDWHDEPTAATLGAAVERQ